MLPCSEKKQSFRIKSLGKFDLQPMQMRTVSRLSNEGHENTGILERRAEYRRGKRRRERARRRLTLYSAESLQLV